MQLSGTLTKAHIFEAVVQNNGYTHQKASETVEILLELIKTTLENGKYELMSSFGKFRIKKERDGEVEIRRQAKT